MRHLLWFVIGVVLAAVGLLLAALGADRASSGLRLQDQTERTTGLVLVLLAGLVLGVLAASRRFSPAGPVAGGLALLALGIVDWVDVSVVVPAVDDVWGGLASGLTVVLATGGVLLVGVLLTVLGLLPGAARRPRGDDGRDDDGFTAVPRNTPQAWTPPAG